MTINEACRKFDVERQVVSYWCRNGLVPGAEKVGRVWTLPDDVRRPANMQGRRGEQKREGLQYAGDKEDYIRRAGAFHSFSTISQRTGLTHRQIQRIYDKLFSEGKVS